MLDVKFIRENPELVQSDAAKKGYDISIKDLGFSYNEDKEVLKNISFDIKSGEKVAPIFE